MPPKILPHHTKFLPTHTPAERAAITACVIAAGIEFAPVSDGVLIFSSQMDEQAFLTGAIPDVNQMYITDYLDYVTFGRACLIAAQASITPEEHEFIITGAQHRIMILAGDLAARLDIVEVARSVVALDAARLIHHAEVVNMGAKQRAAKRDAQDHEAIINEMLGEPKTALKLVK